MFDEVVYILFLILFCKSINAIDEFFVDDPNNLREYNSLNKLNMYFSYSNCSNDDPKLISEFIVLLSLFNGIDIGANLDSDKLVEYAILWLSYKLNQKTQNGTTKLDDFYTNNVAKNRCYDENIGTANNSKIKKDVIEKQIRSMDIDIKDISNFYDAFKSLCNMYSEIGAENYQCNKCLENAGELFEKYEKLKNALDINKGSSYYKLLSSLSNDYKKFENKYNKHACSSISPLVAYPRSSVTKNIIITIAIIFVAASILLGVSYKVNNK
ncbi:putative yir3 protein [Plasmodium yoelii yoelii]|uniref:Yir3 protein n=1 Tax=Plasmodium yoelii yoelii TaxID=73239 RepID=Q7R968_PLAYO|nr:putative yir3 protein [Plasmodium yoelii yoelii]